MAFGAQLTATVFTPEQIVWVNALFVMVGVGLIVTTNEVGVPGQLLKVGVAVMLPTIVPGELLLVLTGAVHELICPLPEPEIPI